MSIFRRSNRDPGDARVEEAERRAREVKVRAEKVARSLSKRLAENHFAEGLADAWGGRHRG